jgi:hypothetical protein
LFANKLVYWWVISTVAFSSGRERLDPFHFFSVLFCNSERSSEMKSWRRLAPSAWCLVMLMVAGCSRTAAPTDSPSATGPTETSSSASLDDRDIRVTGPYVHDNMAVFLIHADHQESGDFLTLQEGLSKGLVEVKEKEQQQVRELLIDNKSDQPLYLQEGERLQGGKQDRIIASSLVIPAHSGKQTLPAFCVEQSRWAEGQKGGVFTVGPNPALAPKAVRGAAKYEKEQGQIWNSVAALKDGAAANLSAANTNSSINELFDAPKILSLSEEYAANLSSILDKHPDAVGVAIAVNGQFEEADIYPNHGLLAKLYPRLVQSYAVQAALRKDQAKEAPSLSSADIVACLKKGPAKSQREERLDSYNCLEIKELDNKRFTCATNYDGRLVNYQVMQKKNAAPNAAKQSDAPANQVRQQPAGPDW